MHAEVRLATARDIAALPEIERDADVLFLDVLARIGLTHDALTQVCSEDALDEARQAGRLWVAQDATGNPIGFATAVELGGYGHLEELAVRRSFGRRGIGGRLLEAVTAWASDIGYPAVTLSTFRDVPWNGPFYEKHGFRETSPWMLSPAHVQLVADEARRGLRTDLRIMMSKPLGAGIRRGSRKVQS